MGTIGIRKEDKSRYERRAPLAPEQMAQAVARGLRFVVEPSPVRVFPDEEYRQAGAMVDPDLSAADLIMCVKEVPPQKILPGKAYIFFSHTTKAQKKNMPMLRRLMDLKCVLIDYEKIADDKRRRLVFFGWHAGVAGMIDTLWVLGRRLAGGGTPFAAMRQALEYRDIAEACRAVDEVGKEISRVGIPGTSGPFVVGLSGYGNVSRGAQSVLDHLPVEAVQPEQLPGLFAPSAAVNDRVVYKVVFKEEHMARRADGGPFVLDEYYARPELYQGTFSAALPWLNVLVNCIYWEPKYPRLVTRQALRELFSAGRLRLCVIGDVSCDVEGSVEVTTEATSQERPVLVYDPGADRVSRAWDGSGVAVLAVDNLPAELPVDATRYFGNALAAFLPALAGMDRSRPFEELDLPPEIKNAVILWNGELTPAYRYLEPHVS